MKRLLATTALAALIASPAFAGGSQDHQCQGGHNCNTGGGTSPSTISVSNSNANSNVNQNRVTTNVSTSIRNSITASQTANGGRGGAGGNAQASGGASSANASTGPVNISNSYTGGAGSDPSSSGAGYSGGTYTVRNTPDVTPPSIVGGNPCTVGASGGIGTTGFGISLGSTWADRSCERRQGAALLWNMGEVKVANALLCQDEHIRQAMREGGHPCLADQTPAPVAYAAPASAMAAPLLVSVKPTAAEALHGVAGADGYCSEHMTAAERRRHHECGAR